MKRRLGIIFIFLCFTLQGYTEINHHLIDSLKVSIEHSKNKDSILLQLSYAYSPDSINTALFYAQEALTLSKKNKNIKIEAGSLYQLGKLHQDLGNFEKALQNYLSSLTLSFNMRDETKTSSILNSIGTIFQIKGEEDKALDYYFRALELAEKTNNKTTLSKIYNNIGVVYRYLENNENALNYFKKSLTISREINNTYFISFALNNIGLIYRNMGNYSEALTYVEQAIEANKTMGNIKGIANSINSAGLIYTKLGQYEKAIQKFREAEILQNQIHDSLIMISTYLNFGEAYQLMNNTSKSIYYFLKALNLSIKHKYTPAISEAYSGLAKDYAYNKNFVKAYQYQLKYSFLKDSLSNIELSKAVTELDHQFKTKNEEQENEILRKNSEIQKLVIEKYKNNRNYLILILILLLAMIIIILHTFMINKKTNKQLAEKNQAVEQMNSELSTLNEDLEEKIKNRIQALEREIQERTEVQEQIKDALKKAEKANALKESFLANISHEIRTPLNGIIGFVNLLKNPENSQAQQNIYIETIGNCSIQLLSIIGDIIEISKVETGQLPLYKSECSLSQIINDVYYIFQSELSRKNKAHIDIKKPVIKEKDILFTSDLDKIELIFRKLISNAVKFTNVGFIEYGYMISDDNSNIRFFIKDTGIGISDEEQKFIFDNFCQADNSLTRLYGGTGLGLSICKGIIDMMNGKIWVESKKDMGSVFNFEIPIEQTHTKEIKETSATKYENDFNWNDKNILIIEDDLYSQKYLIEALRASKCNILIASDGEKALEIVHEHPEIDLILLDIQLPMMNGYDVTREIKKERPTLTIIAQTANALSEDKIKCIEAGCDNYIAKPLSKEKLIELISLYFER